VNSQPVSVRVLALVQAALGLLALVAAVVYEPPAVFPSWFATLAVVIPMLHLASAFCLWRLHWAGPASFVALWILSLAVGHIGVPAGARPSPAGLIFSLAGFLAYLGVVVGHRRRFTPNNSSKPTPLRGAA